MKKKILKVKKKEVVRSDSRSCSSEENTPTTTAMFGDMFNTPTSTTEVFTFGAPERKTELKFTHTSELEKMLAKNSYSDMTITIDDKSWAVHKLIISQCNNIDISKDTFALKDVAESTWIQILSYLYSGEALVSEKNYMTLLKASDVLGCPFLLNSCFEWIVKVQCTTENVCTLLMDAKHGAYGKIDINGLVEKSQSFVSREAQQVFKSKTFLELDQDLIEKFTTADTLSIDEVELYDALVSWAKARIIKDQSKSLQDILNGLLKNVRLCAIEADHLIQVIKKDKYIPYERILVALEAQIAPECFTGEVGNTDLIPRSGTSSRWNFPVTLNTKLFKVENKNCTITKISGGNQWNNAMLYGSKPLKTGKSYFEFKINMVNGDKSGYAIGLSKQDKGTSQYSSDMVVGLSGYAYNCQGSNSQVVNQGDTVGLLVDFGKGKCYFFHNGKQMTPYGVLSKGQEYWPCVHLYYANDSFTLSFPSKVPRVTNP